MKGDGDAYEIAPFELALGKGQFDGTLKADLSRKRPRFDLELGIDEADIRPLFPAGKPVGISAKPRSDSTEKLFSDSPFPRAWMNAADIDARVRIRNLITPYTTGRHIEIDAELKARRLRVDLVGKAIGDRSVRARLKIDGSAEPVAVQLGIEGDKLMIAPLVATTEASGMVKGDLDLSLDLQAAGGSANQLAHALNGKLLLVEQAEADLTQLNRLTPGVRNLFGQLARSQAKLARINCGVAAFELSGG